MKDAKRFLLLAASAILIVVATAMNTQAQQRDPNSPRPTPTPSPTPPSINRIPRDVIRRETGARLGELPGIYGTIRWIKEMGLPYDASRVMRPPYPICNMFRVRITVQHAGAPGSFGATRTLGNFNSSGNPTEDGHHYVCSYGLPDKGLLPRNRTMVVSADLDTRVLRGAENEQWSVGNDTMPPPGQQRAIIIVGGRGAGITLTDNQPHATVDFELVYRPIPAPPR